MGIGGIVFIDSAELVGINPYYRYDCFHIVFFKQRVGVAVIIVVSVVKCEHYGLFGQGSVFIDKVDKVGYKYRSIAVFLYVFQILFKHVGTYEIFRLKIGIFDKTVIHEYRHLYCFTVIGICILRFLT